MIDVMMLRVAGGDGRTCVLMSKRVKTRFEEAGNKMIKRATDIRSSMHTDTSQSRSLELQLDYDLQ